MYELLSRTLLKINPQYARAMACHATHLASKFVHSSPPESLRRKVMGLEFPGPIGMAAGFDKHGELYLALSKIGFGFVEIGSVVPQPEHQRSRGLEAVAANLMRYSHPHPIPLGVSLSMNRKTPFAQMFQDYLIGMRGLWKYADYFVINLGVRAGPDLHLQENRAALYKVLTNVKDEQCRLNNEHGAYCPLVVKIDQHRGDTNALLCCVRDFCFDGLILSGDKYQSESNCTLTGLANAVKILSADTAVISVGGICTPQDAANHLSAGAALIQIYSGLVTSGPMLPRRINMHLSNTLID